mmetsp:Transcript_66713/g.211071  ORF Transcript_66713/g.211071 Transcript_66713/m.211071 type:complete len:409 (+) Transcript_66713:59-1285(+)
MEDLALPVLNTFVHFSEDGEGSPMMLHTKSDSLTSMGFLARRAMQRRTALVKLSAVLGGSSGPCEPGPVAARLVRSDSSDSTSIDSNTVCHSDSDDNNFKMDGHRVVPEDADQDASAVMESIDLVTPPLTPLASPVHINLGAQATWEAPTPSATRPAHVSLGAQDAREAPNSVTASGSPLATRPVLPALQTSPAGASVRLVPFLWPVAMPMAPPPAAAPAGQPAVAPPQQPAAMPVAAPAPQPQAGQLLSKSSGDFSWFPWTVPAADVESTNNKIHSGTFLVTLPGYGACPFQIILYAEDRASKLHSDGFQRSRGRGRVEVRCQAAQLPQGVGQVATCVLVGSRQHSLPSRAPVVHDFSRQACCGWRRMDFGSAVDPATRSFTVCVGFALPAMADVQTPASQRTLPSR